MNSASDRHPSGLANSSGLVGRYFTPHGAAGLFGMFPEETENHMGRTGGQLLSQEAYAKTSKRGFLSGYTWRIGNALKFGDIGGIANTRLDLVGPPLTAFMARAPKHLATMSVLAENLPDLDNRVELVAEKDRFGVPLAKLVNTLGIDARKCVDAAVAEGQEDYDSPRGRRRCGRPRRERST